MIKFSKLCKRYLVTGKCFVVVNVIILISVFSYTLDVANVNVMTVSYISKRLTPAMWKWLFRQPLPLPHLSFPLPFLQTKSEKTTVDIFFLLLWVCGLPSATLHHFGETKTYAYTCITITLFSSLKRIVPNYSVFVFS